MGEMKTTLELPDELMRAARVRAAVQGRRLKDVVAELIRLGLAAEPSGGGAVRTRVRLPLVRCGHAATAAEEMTPERVAALLAGDDATAVRQRP
jgi:plasmid stability protein